MATDFRRKFLVDMIDASGVLAGAVDVSIDSKIAMACHGYFFNGTYDEMSKPGTGKSPLATFNSQRLRSAEVRGGGPKKWARHGTPMAPSILRA